MSASEKEKVELAHFRPDRITVLKQQLLEELLNATTDQALPLKFRESLFRFIPKLWEEETK